MFKLLILSIIFSIVGSEIQDFDALLDALERSGSNVTSNIPPNQQTKVTIIFDDNLSSSKKPVDDNSKSLGQCRRNSDCFSIPYSFCSLGKCECWQNYILSDGKCRGLLQEDCEYESDCFPRDSVCLLGTCQCPATHYSKDGKCYGFATRLGFPVHSSEACRYLNHSIFSSTSESCECAPGYVQGYGQCLAELGTKCSRDFDCAPRDSVCSLETCQCSVTHYSRSHHKLNGSCYFDDQCKVPYSECAYGKCKCKQNYLEHDQVCYGMGSAKCNKSTDCAFINRDCKSGTCTNVRHYTDGELMSSKPGVTAVYGHHLNYRTPESFDFHLGEPGYNPGPEKAGNLHWVRNFTLDKVILPCEWGGSFVYVWCRAKTNAGKFTTGKVRIPVDGLCKVDFDEEEFETNDWDVLVDLGPVNCNNN